MRVCVIYEDGAVRGFLPYQFQHRTAAWLKAAERVGGEMTDYFGLIAKPDFRIEPKTLLRLAQLNYFSFSHLDEPQLAHGLTGEQPRVGLRIRLSADAEDPLTALPSVQRKYLRDTESRQRKLVNQLGPIHFVLDSLHDRKEVLDNLIHHKRAQYGRTSASDALRNAWARTLLHQLSECQFDTCRSVLSTMHAGDHWLATHFGIMGNGVLQLWFPVYNAAYAQFAPGRLLIQHIIRSTRTSPIPFHTLDRGEGDNPSKRELANDEHLFYRGIWRNNSVTSQVAHGLQRIKWRLGI